MLPPSVRKRCRPGVGNPNWINRRAAASSGFFHACRASPQICGHVPSPSGRGLRAPSGGRHLLSGISYPAEPRPPAVGSGDEVHEPQQETEMSELIDQDTFNIIEGRPVTSSRTVGNYFGKKHSDVVRAIAAIIEKKPELEASRNFAQWSEDVEIGSGAKRTVTGYWMGFSILAMGFTGAKALDFKCAVRAHGAGAPPGPLCYPRVHHARAGVPDPVRRAKARAPRRHQFPKPSTAHSRRGSAYRSTRSSLQKTLMRQSSSSAPANFERPS